LSAKQTLGGRYELGGTLGEGGMATVFEGVDTVLDRPVAVKVLASRYATDTTFVQRFRREAQSAAAMNHPNIVNVYDTGSDDSTHYIVMELVEGKTLREVIAEDGPLLPERAAEIAEAVAAALGFAHERGIVHRDVKPGNIMITPSGDAKVMDFGIARATAGESLTQTATVLGTATYLSPEQAQGEQVDARSDIYSLGIVLYEMLTAHVPFEGESPVAVAYKHVREDPMRPSALNADVPDPLERVVLKAMAKNPENRYSTANDMRQDLARFLAGRPVEATPLLPPDQTEVITRQARDTMVLPATGAMEPERRGMRTAVIVLLALLALLALGALFFFLAKNIIGPETAQVEVPDCVGNTENGCRQLLEAKGLQIGDVELEPSDDAPAGTIIDQDPGAGDQVDPDTKVDLTVSSGKQRVQVPNVTGKSEEAARSILENAGFNVFVNDEPNDEFEKGIVFDQKPKGGAKVQDGATVEIFVSEGPQTVAVPDCVEQTLDECRALLADAGLVLGTVDEGFCVPPVAPGTVCSQDPAPGTEVDPGTSVDVIVQTGEESPTPTGSPTPTETPPT
jgi:eukaryotic-like serine/threonine-protein kinase